MNHITFSAPGHIGLSMQVNAWAPIGKIAERLGVKPLEGRQHRATLVACAAEYLPMHGGHIAPTYDVFEVVEALLDRIEIIKESAAAQGEVGK